MSWPRVALLVVLFAGLVTAAESPLPALESVRAHFERREYAPALADARAWLSRAEAEHGRASREAAEALEWIARVMAGGHLGEKAERVAAAERALALRKAQATGRDPEFAFAHYVVGLVHYLADAPLDALPAFERALALAESAYGPSDPELEWYVREYGAALFSLGRYREALRAFERLDALSRAKYGAGNPGAIDALFNRALTHDVLGDFEAAQVLYEEALGILERQRPPDVEKLAWTLDAHSGLLARQGRLGEGLAECERAIELRRRRHGPDSPELARSLVVEGRMLLMMGDYEKARHELEASIAIQRRSPASDALFSAYLNLATLLRLAGDLTAARAALDETRKAGEASLAEDHGLWFGFHAESGEVLARLGDRGAARGHYARALEISGATMGERHYDFGATLASLGRLDLLDGDPAGARIRLERALEILVAQLGGQHPLCQEAQEALGDVYVALDRGASAFTVSLASERARRELERATLAVLPERQALAQASRPRDGRDLMLALALAPGASADRRTAAYDALIRSRAVVFDEIAARQRVFRARGDTLTEALLERFAASRARLAGLFVHGPGNDPAGYVKRVGAARDEVESIDAALARRSAPYRARLSAREFGVDALRRALPRRSACLSYARIRRPNGRPGERSLRYVAVLQRPGATVPRFFDLGPADDIDRTLARWRAALEPSAVFVRDSATTYTIPATELRRRVWDPLEAHLEGVDTLFVVLDGSLHLASLAALPTGRHSFLLEDGPALHYLTAERDLSGAPEPAGGAGLLALGDPAFEEAGALSDGAEAYRGGTAHCPNFEEVRFGPLPATADEVRAVRSIWAGREGARPVQMLEGRGASEREFKRLAPGKEVLHLATHGFFLGDDCAAPGPHRGIGGLSPGREAGASVTGDSSPSPLLLSGLALAGANRRSTAAPGADDGILTAEEVSALDLSGVRVAVLSACRTGAGTISSGEGVFGLRRAFLTAGAATVVTNLWDVEDRAGQAWIEEFYRERLLQGRTIPESARRASLTVLHARRAAKLDTHPFYWAGWIAAGRAN